MIMGKLLIGEESERLSLLANFKRSLLLQTHHTRSEGGSAMRSFFDWKVRGEDDGILTMDDFLVSENKIPKKPIETHVLR